MDGIKEAIIKELARQQQTRMRRLPLLLVDVDALVAVIEPFISRASAVIDTQR